MDAEKIVEKIKELVRQGNVSRVRIRRGEDVILNLPMTAGVAGGVIGLAAAPWAVILAALAAVGFSCTVEVVEESGKVNVIYDGHRK